MQIQPNSERWFYPNERVRGALSNSYMHWHTKEQTGNGAVNIQIKNAEKRIGMHGASLQRFACQGADERWFESRE